MPIPTPILPENSTATITPQDQTPQPSSGVLEPANLGFGEAGDRAGFNQAPFAQPGESAPVEPQKHSRQTDKAQHDIILSPVVNISEFGSLRLDRITKAKSSSSKKEELEQGVRLTEQRPAAYRFGMRGEKLDVLPEPPKLEDRQFALDIYEELNAKARQLRERLTRTNSASRVCNSVERLVSALGTRFDDLRPGILLSRARSIEADRTAFDNEEARGELFADAFAMMDDTLQTLRDLLAASPIVRRIEAERLALDLDRNANAVPIIQRQMDAIKVAAEKSGAATEAAISALAQNDAAIEDATTQVELTGLVADKLLVFANFVRAVIGGTASYGRSALTKGGSVNRHGIRTPFSG